MANKSLGRIVGLDRTIQQKMERAGLKTAADALVRSELELVQLLDCPLPVLKEVLRCICEVVAPKPVLLSEKLNSQTYLPTTLGGLDTTLRGGIPAGSITEIVGPSGVGKTQFCHMLSVLAAREGGVVYIDTEKAFSAPRLLEIAEAMDPVNFNRTDNTGNLLGLSRRITVYNDFPTSMDVLKRIESLEDVIMEEKVKLIVLDSVASILRKDFDSQSAFQRQSLLSQEAIALKYIAETFGIPIIVTNQVTTVYSTTAYSFQSDTQRAQANRIAPALGNFWAHCVNTRLVLEFGSGNPNPKLPPNPATHHGVRRLTVAKSPSAPVVSFLYHVNTAGLQLNEGEQASTSDTNAGGANRQNFWEQNISTRRS